MFTEDTSMPNGDHRCAICDAEFASSKELAQHERTRHTHPAGTDAEHSPHQADPADQRQNREFTRRNIE
jgi:hypothetical protein